jgi:lipase chaperone LimK|tara:strand:- start:453 stop:650 length:198 start_codon:yes stop_codon:yes gene_type:complete
LKKKATKKDIEIVISNIIQNLEQINGKLSALDNVFGTYINYKKDEKGFKKYISSQLEAASDGNDK